MDQRDPASVARSVVIVAGSRAYNSARKFSIVLCLTTLPQSYWHTPQSSIEIAMRNECNVSRELSNGCGGRRCPLHVALGLLGLLCCLSTESLCTVCPVYHDARLLQRLTCGQLSSIQLSCCRVTERWPASLHECASKAAMIDYSKRINSCVSCIAYKSARSNNSGPRLPHVFETMLLFGEACF